MGTHTLASYNSTGITLTNDGNYLSPFTITQTGTVVTAYPSSGIYSAILNPSLLNKGSINGGYEGVDPALGGDGVQFMDGGAVTNSGTDATISGGPDGIYIAGSSGTVVNQGTISKIGSLGGAGVFLDLGGAVTNSGTASAIFAGVTGAAVYIFGAPGTVVNQGTISAVDNVGVVLNQGGTVTNSGTATFIAGYGNGVDIKDASGTVLNAGTIAGTGLGGVGVLLSAGGYVANNGTSALIQGYGGGVDIANAAGTVVNSGNITVTGTAGAGVFVAGGYVVNRGMITGGSNQFAGAGVVSHVAVIIGSPPPPATVVNDATISGGGWGVELQAGSVTNSGTASMIYGGLDGVYIGSTSIVSTVWNEGTIAGDDNGVALSTPGRITNSGTDAVILARSTSGLGIRAEGYAVSVLNAGTISGNWGVDLNAGGTVTSTGEILGRGTDGVGVFIDGNATVNSSGTISGGAYGVRLELGGSRTVTNFGTISGGTVGVEFDPGQFDPGENTVDNFGTISGGTYAVRFINGEDDRLIVHPGAVFSGEVAALQAATATLELAGTSPPMGTITGIGSQVVGFPTIQFDSLASWLAAGDFAGFDNDTIILLGSLDVIDVTDFKADVDTMISLDSSGVLAIPGTLGASAVTLDLTFSSADLGDVFTITPDGAMGTDIFLCFYPGTRIATPDGWVAVEDLRPGDMVRTAGGDKPVRWIGENPVATRFADPLRVLPIRIRVGALGDGLPARDLLLSPDHAIFLSGILVQAGALVNGVTIFREKNVPARFTYYHVELASHELLFAEGVMAESFVDNLDRMYFANWDSRRAPDDPIAEMEYPRAKAARQVPRALRRMLAPAPEVQCHAN